MKTVRYIFPTSHHYRLPFHERLRKLLLEHDVDYRVVYCEPGEENRKKKDTVDIAWGVKVPRTDLPGGLIYQHGLREGLGADLAIIQQENALAMNYLLNVASAAGAARVAYFGHGRNFQSRNPQGLSESWKRFWAKRCDWWFGYTDETRRHVEALGYPPERITVFNNAVDTTALTELSAGIDEAEVARIEASLGIAGTNLCVFVGGLYPDKRLDFLVEAGERIRREIPDFEMLVVGGGVDQPKLEAMAASRPWLFVAGPRFGREKVALMKGAKLFLMPGLVGLAVLDAAALDLPIVTTDYPYHSPEIAYLRAGGQGEIVPEWTSSEHYAAAVIALLRDEERRQALQQAGRQVMQTITIDKMAGRFAEGVLKALRQPKLARRAA